MREKILSSGLIVPALESQSHEHEWLDDKSLLPSEHFSVEDTLHGANVDVAYQPVDFDITDEAILISPGFSAGKSTMRLLQITLAQHGFPSYALTHHRNHNSRYTIQDTHAYNDLAVMHESYVRHGFKRFNIVGWSMGGGDGAHAAEASSNSEHDVVAQLIALNSMGLIDGSSFNKTANGMMRELAYDAALIKDLPLRKKLQLVTYAADSVRRLSTNLTQTQHEAAFASSFDIRGLLEELIKHGLKVSVINSENDKAFNPVQSFEDTSELMLEARIYILGRWATHLSGLFVPTTTAKAIILSINSFDSTNFSQP